MTAAVAFSLAFINLLRGTVAVGTPAVLLVFVVAVSIDADRTDFPAAPEPPGSDYPHLPSVTTIEDARALNISTGCRPATRPPLLRRAQSSDMSSERWVVGVGRWVRGTFAHRFDPALAANVLRRPR